MARDVARDWMWSEACEMLARAERMHRELFRPAGTQARLPAWEPPVDILETEFEVLALVALPGVDADNAQAVIEDGDLVVTGTRVLPVELRTAEQARTIAAGADGVVVGSALVDAVRKSLGPGDKPTVATVPAVTGLVRELAEGVRAGRV